jgi:DNA-binding phage protein
MPTSSSYHSHLIESLKDPQEAAAYLDAVLEDCSDDELLLALRNVAQARPDLLKGSQVSANRDIVQTILSSEANLDLAHLRQAFCELGFKLSVTPIEDAA